MTDKRWGVWSMRTILDLHQGRARNDLLFTMSDNTHTPRRTRADTKSFSLLDEQSVLIRHAYAACAHTTTAPRPDLVDADNADLVDADDGATGQLTDRQSGGARRDRTDDLLLAKQALSQLSYGPFRDQMSVIGNQKKN